MEKNKNRTIQSAAILLALAACSAPQFKVTLADNRFTENRSQILISENNRVSTKSVAGGIHIDDKGVNVDPFVEKDVETGRVLTLGFNLVNKSNYDSMMGNPNDLGTLAAIAFSFNGGDLIRLQAVRSNSQYDDTISYNSVGNYAEYDRWDTATVLVDLDEYDRIADATDMAIKITGTRQSMTYEPGDIEPTFRSNLQQFRRNYIQ